MKTTLVTLASLLALATPALAQTVTPVAKVERETMVTLKGTVDRITDTDEFRLRDD